MSIQGLQQNPQDTSNFYLANIYQATINPISSNVSDSPPASSPPFSPSNSAVWVNALWFLSLVISLTCALLATLLQQWARRYLKFTQSRYSPHKRARIRAFFAEGVEKCLLPWIVDALPTLLHISLFLFFSGLVVFLCNVNLTIFKLVLSWVGLCTALYGCITCIPIFRHDSPYYTPLSLLAWHIVIGTRFLIYRFLRWLNDSVRIRHHHSYLYLELEKRWRKSLVQGMHKTAEETALYSPPEIDTRSFMWTFDCLHEDHELERFFSGLPGFRSSNVVVDPLPGLTEEEKLKLYQGLRGLLDRTFSSDLLPVPVKTRRAMICAKAVNPKHTIDAFGILDTILFEYRHGGPVATGIAKGLIGCEHSMDRDEYLYSQFLISTIIARRQPDDDSWYSLASNELVVPEVVLREYAGHGDNLSLLILIHVVQQQFIHFRISSWPRHSFSYVLATASKFNVKDTSPELQHEFRALWNQIVNEAQDGADQNMAFLILREVRNIFLALHQDTNSAPTWFSVSTGNWDSILRQPSSYPVCKVPGHQPDSPSHIHVGRASTIFTPAVPDDHDNIALGPSLPSPDRPPLSIHSPFPVDETLTDAPPVNNNMSLPVQITPEDSRIPSSLNLVTSRTIHGSMVTYPRRMHFSTSELSTSSPLPKSNTSASDVAVGCTEVGHEPSDDLNVRSSPSTPVLDTMILKGLLLFFC